MFIFIACILTARGAILLAEGGITMIHENIRRARLARGLSQQELAEQLHVVRQTISKWEKGLSVPDADVLVRISEVLDAPVEALLGVSDCRKSSEALARELTQRNEELAVRIQEENLRARADRVRGLILLMCFISMVIAMHAGNERASMLLICGCLLAATLLLYRNLELLTKRPVRSSGLAALRATTIFTGVALISLAAILCFDQSALLRLFASGERALACALVCVVMLFGGFISPRLPFNRHTGLRLPWTVRDEDTWNVAHRIVGWISLPLVLLYLGASIALPDNEAITAAAMLMWIGIPGLLSLAFYYKRYRFK